VQALQESAQRGDVAPTEESAPVVLDLRDDLAGGLWIASRSTRAPCRLT
jgi:hypothetical protein